MRPRDLEALLTAAERELGVRLSILDYHGVLRRPDGQPLFNWSRFSRNQAAHCASCDWDSCKDDCIAPCDERAQRESRPFIISCWKQLIELAAPIRDRGHYLGALLAGPWRPESVDSDEWAEDELVEWEEATALTPVFDPARIERLGPIVDSIATTIAVAWDESLPVVDGSREAGDIIRLIKSHYWQPLKLQDLADHLGVSSSHASHLVTDHFDHNFRDLLKEERLTAAQMLLKNTDYLVGEIAPLVGIADEQHFSRLFKKSRGISPGQFRRRG